MNRPNSYTNHETDNPGIIFEVKRRDGYPFAGTRLDIKYSEVKS